ncbi:helix-turn-helix domain-containing protein [Cohnella sp. CFH 77786]|uniref:AraC family transcriptional regulator n=1 Tax=Cohnella sp. CFH 77786 TaxID=2662265 RepID=UPI001C609FE4|nr:AraC family transcriptional regulator [Cohnella sp. CFH 77786]MBW5445373.1 helix-turn-helix domain-containing protein [Cohnella sp. CFH 77786]
MLRQSHLLTISDNPYFVFPESVGAYRDYPEHSVSREKGALGNFNIHYVASGKGYVVIEGRVHDLKRGDAVLYFPAQEQRYYSSKDQPWDIRWVHFYGNGLAEYLRERGFHQRRLWTLRQPDAWERAHLELLEEADNHKMLRPTRLSTLTYAVIAEFVNQAVPLEGFTPSMASSRILKLLAPMQQEAHKPFILEEWAERAGITPHYFCKLFRRTMQMSPLDYVTRCRLQLAKQWLLERMDARIGQISEDAGYPSVSYFNRKFHEHEGMTPSEYRRLFGK